MSNDSPPSSATRTDTRTHTDAASVRAQWEAAEGPARARLARAGVASPAQVSGLSGLAMLEAIGRGELPSVPIGHTLDFWPVEVSVGRIVFQGRPSFAVLNPMGTVHGGWMATLLDSAVGCAIHSTLPAGKGYTTLELKINCIRAITADTGPVRAEGKVIHVGSRVGTAEGRITGPDGKLYAHATTTCLIMDAAR